MKRCTPEGKPSIVKKRDEPVGVADNRRFVEMLISQHAVHLQALQDLYNRCVRREGFPGSPVEESIQGYPSTHAILDRLGLIKYAEGAVEDPQRVLADLVDFIKCLESASDCCLDSVESSTTESTSNITVSDNLSPEPNTRRNSPHSAVPLIAGPWATAMSDKSRLSHAYGEYKPMNPQYTDMALGGPDEACAIRTDEYIGVPRNYCEPQIRYISAGINNLYPRAETFDIPPSSSSSSWTEIPDQPSVTFMPSASRASVSEPLVYITEQSGFSDAYTYAQGRTFGTAPVQRQLRHSVDYGPLNSGGQYGYL